MKKLLITIGVTLVLGGISVMYSPSEARNTPPLRAYTCHHVVNGVVSPRIYAWAASEFSCPAPPHNENTNNNPDHPSDKDHHPLDHECDTVSKSGTD